MENGNKNGILMGFAGVAGLALSALSLPANAGPIEAGDDIFNSTGEVILETFPNPFGIPIFSETIALSSKDRKTIVRRDQQVGNVIDTELVSLDLFGTSTNVGPIHVRAGTGNEVPVSAGPSIGQIIDVITGPGTDPSAFISGDSYFDVFFEIDIDVAAMTLFNKDVCRAVADNIMGLPPVGATYEKLAPGCFVYIQDDQIVGVVKVKHTVPEPATLALFATGFLVLGLQRMRG